LASREEGGNSPSAGGDRNYSRSSDGLAYEQHGAEGNTRGGETDVTRYGRENAQRTKEKSLKGLVSQTDRAGRWDRKETLEKTGKLNVKRMGKTENSQRSGGGVTKKKK